MTQDDNGSRLPAFFEEACAGRGPDTYEVAGYKLGSNIPTLQPDGLDYVEWCERLSMLEDSEVDPLMWLAENFCRCVELVPERQRGRLAQGFMRAITERSVG